MALVLLPPHKFACPPLLLKVCRKLENGFGMTLFGIMLIPSFTEFVKLFVT